MTRVDPASGAAAEAELTELTVPPVPVEPPTLWSLFDRQATRTPEAPALIDDARTCTYGQLSEHALDYAAAFAGHGVRPGDTVAVYLPNGVDFAACALATVRLGAVLVPINVRFRVPEVRDLLESVRPRVVVTQPSFLTNPLLDRLTEAVTDPSMAVVVAGEPLPLGEVPPLPHVRESDRFVVFWTSGSTGPPKGVVHTHALMRNVWNWVSVLGLTPDDRVLATRPFYYIAGACWNLFGVLATGGSVVLGSLFTAQEMAHALVAHRVTVMSGGPAIYDALLDLPAFRDVRRDQLAVRRAVVGGAPLSRRLFDRITERFAGVPLIQTYGMTELRGYCMSTRPSDAVEVRFATVGRLLPGIEAQLRESDGARITEPDVAGQLFVRGDILLDYTRDGRLVPAREPDGWFATGDVLSRRADGNWVFHSRQREIAKVRGESVSLSSVDLALAELPQVARAVTVAFADVHGDRLEAVVELRGAATPDAVLAAAREAMAPFRVPARLWVKPSSAPWPTLPSGKISRMLVAQQFAREASP